VAWTKAYLHIKWHLDPVNRMATIDQHYKHKDKQDNDLIAQSEPLLGDRL